MNPLCWRVQSRFYVIVTEHKNNYFLHDCSFTVIFYANLLPEGDNLMIKIRGDCDV